MKEFHFGKDIAYGKILSRIIRFMHQKNPWLIPIIVIGTIGAVISTYYPVIFQRTIVNQLLGQPTQTQLIQTVLAYFAIMVVASSLFALANGYCNSRFSLIRLDFMAEVNRKYLEMDYKYFEDAAFSNELGNAMSATQGNEMGYEYFMKMLFKLPASIISIIILGLLIGKNTPIILLGLLINVLVVFWVKDNVKRLQYAHRDDLMATQRKTNYYSYKTADFTFGKDIRIFGLRNLLIQGFQRQIQLAVDLHQLFQQREFRLGLFSVLTLTMSDVLIFGSLVGRAINGLPIADFTMLLTASASLSLLLKVTIEEFAKLIGEARYVQGAYDFLEADLGDQSGTIDQVPTGPLTIEFDHVSFRYPNSDHQVLSDVSFRLSAGEKLAIVGVNGAGKTTLIKLLTGLYRPDEGDILINGISQSAYTKKTLYQMFACVFQDIAIMPFDVRTNVTISQTKTGDDQRVWEALDKAGLKDKIVSLKNGLDQKLNKGVYEDGTNLSGGEAQKLTIARALYKDGNMIILDEPTAALDALAEQAIYAQFNRLIEDKTAIYISHRLASTQFCDRIILLDGARIKEMGSHQELLDLKGDYHHMFKLQGQYYQDGGNDEEV